MSQQNYLCGHCGHELESRKESRCPTCNTVNPPACPTPDKILQLRDEIHDSWSDITRNTRRTIPRRPLTIPQISYIGVERKTKGSTARAI